MPEPEHAHAPMPFLSLYADEIIRLAACRHCGKQGEKDASSQNLMNNSDCRNTASSNTRISCTEGEIRVVPLTIVGSTTLVVLVYCLLTPCSPVRRCTV
jgi:hypothetical protein